MKFVANIQMAAISDLTASTYLGMLDLAKRLQGLSNREKSGS